jgi:alpha-D-ribose 1-methylphosphonate 5-triphosphate synthase subunit PhnL
MIAINFLSCNEKNILIKNKLNPMKKTIKRVPTLLTGKRKKKISAAKAALIRKKILLLDYQFAKLVETNTITKKTLIKGKEILKNKLDSLSEMGEMESLRLQMAMDRLSKMMTTLSNILKKISDTASTITQNIK